MTDVASIVAIAARINGLTPKDWQTLGAAEATLKPWGAAVAKTFYDVLYADPDAARVLGEGNRATRERVLREWYERLVSGDPGPRFWEHTWMVGWVHILANVKNVYMMSIGLRVEGLFLAGCLEHFERERALEVYSAFRRVFGTVTAIIAESYVSGLVAGMEFLGINPKLVERMRNTFIARGIDEMRRGLTSGR
jgi:hypothetical protein